MSNNKKKWVRMVYSFFMYGSVIISYSTTADAARESETFNADSLHIHYQQLCDRIIDIWSVLDVMRSINIEPHARGDFINKLFSDVIAIMREVVIVEVGCTIYREYSDAHQEEMGYFFDMVRHVEDAFESVFTPLVLGEEKLLSLCMMEFLSGVQTIKRNLIA